MIRSLGRERAVLLSTHILPEVDAVCDRVLIIDRGRIVAEGTPQELRRAPGRHRPSSARPSGARSPRVRRVEGLPGVVAVEETADDGETRVRLECADGADRRRRSSTSPWPGAGSSGSSRAKRLSLEDVFVRLTRHDEAVVPSGAGETPPRRRSRRPAPDGGSRVKRFLAIVGREWRAYFLSPLAYVILAAFLVMNGLIFYAIVAFLNAPDAPKGQALPYLFTNTYFWIFNLFVVPIIAMRLFAEERKSGTIESPADLPRDRDGRSCSASSPARSASS